MSEINIDQKDYVELIVIQKIFDAFEIYFWMDEKKLFSLFHLFLLYALMAGIEHDMPYAFHAICIRDK